MAVFGVVTAASVTPPALAVDVRGYGVAADSKVVSDAQVTAGSAVVTSATANFASTAVGKMAVLPGVISTVVSVQSPTQVTLADNAVTTDSAAQFAWGTDNTPALNAAIAAAFTGPARRLFLPSGGILTRPLTPFTDRGLTITGSGKDRGTRIDVAGGDFIVFGSDNGLAYDGNYYDGPQGFYGEHFTVQAVGIDTDLLGASWIRARNLGPGKYRAGAKAFTDWRAGDIRLHDVRIQGFEYWFWGIQSDINYWHDIEILFCANGYIGPRSDQLTAEIYGFGCDRLLEIDSLSGATLRIIQVGCGGTSKAGVLVHAAYSIGCRNITFRECWSESQAGQGDLNAAFAFGLTTDAYTATGITFTGVTTILTGLSGVGGASAAHHFKSFIRVSNADQIIIDNVGELDLSYLDQLVEFVGTTSPIVAVQTRYPQTGAARTALNYVNNGTGTPRMLIETVDLLGGALRSPVRVMRSGGTTGQQSQLRMTAGDPPSRTAYISAGDDNGTTFTQLSFGNGGSAANQKYTVANSSGTRFADSIGGSTYWLQHDVTNGISLARAADKLGLFGATPAVKPTVTGSRGGNAALASMLIALSTLGLITDSTTA